jgi:predicted DNA binding CopG/RHH family protein
MRLQRVSKMSRNPLKLDEEELQILRDFERGEFESIQHFRKEKRGLQAAVRRTLQKDKRINIRIFPPATWRSYKNEPPWKVSPIRH